ncbi:MAG: redoxin domain-containing protein [Cytophagales bacterium]|nr:redoxin domain-containing protein [Cytophagales bacterium]
MKKQISNINTEYGWLNTDKSYSIKDLAGKIVLLDFWTLGCINCQHIIPDLKRLEDEYSKELVVIGVHSAKFTSEKKINNIRKAILKFGIEHPVVNDADFRVWKSYGVRAWPTVVLIAPDGKVIGQSAGEGFYEIIKENIDRLIKEYGDQINRNVIAFQLEKEERSILRFPSKMISPPLTPPKGGRTAHPLNQPDGKSGGKIPPLGRTMSSGHRASPVGGGAVIYISDSGHNRILKINKEGKILEIIGSGKKGFDDGGYVQATFYEPHGLALKDQTLYVADSKNNAIRRIDLQNKKVETIAGDGTLGNYPEHSGWNVNVKPNSPWDLLIEGNDMYIANAGNHQILRMDLSNNHVYRFAGSGREALTNGNLEECAFNQPSGLTKIGNILYVADAEASAIRAINLEANTVKTPFGKGLFEFGDKDGNVEEALLQHCVGVANKAGKIYIADTYNGKVKILDLEKGKISTFIAGLNEPNDITFINDEMWISDTNNHRVIKVNMETNEKSIVNIK